MVLTAQLPAPVLTGSMSLPSHPLLSGMPCIKVRLKGDTRSLDCSSCGNIGSRFFGLA